MNRIRQITPEEYQSIPAAESYVLIDVREPFEWDICQLENAMFIPLGDLQNHLEELDPDARYLFYCHHGNRSNVACAMALEQGISNVANLAGGIEAWSNTIDPKVPRY